MVDILSDMDLIDHIEKKPKELHAADATAAIKTKILKMDQKTLVKSNSGALLLPEFILKIPYLQRMHGRLCSPISRIQVLLLVLFLDINCTHPKRVAGDGLLESEFLMLLFCSLPPSWETFIASIDFTDVDNDDEKIKNKAVASILVHLQVKGT